jgi:hypothetical protein
VWKKNIKSAFRLLNVYPGDFDLLGIKFLDEYYIDKCMPMVALYHVQHLKIFNFFTLGS